MPRDNDRAISLPITTEIVAEVDGQIMVWVRIADREYFMVFEGVA